MNWGSWWEEEDDGDDDGIKTNRRKQGSRTKVLLEQTGSSTWHVITLPHLGCSQEKGYKYFDALFVNPRNKPLTFSSFTVRLQQKPGRGSLKSVVILENSKFNNILRSIC